MVVAWTSKNPKLNIYMINDILSSMGWELSVLHAPPALHLCLTSANIGSLPGLIADLRTSVAESFENQNNSSSGMAPIYGLGNALPDRNLVGEMLKEIQDVMLHYS
jgi:sphinganine-1-phosphate aldolase